MDQERQEPSLERLHETLVTALRRAGRSPDQGTLTVAEIYQDLLPYRVARSELGFEMNADYEHALMRLLSGEEDLVLLEPPEARRAIRDELASGNPDVALYRRFAACDVRVRPPTEEASEVAVVGLSEAAPVRERGADAEQISGLFEEDDPWSHPDPRIPSVPRGVEASARSGEKGGGRPEGGGPVGSRVDVRLAASVAPKEEKPAVEPPACAQCGAELPTDRRVRYCPYCGTDLRPRCAACGELLDADWRFCIACGAPVAGNPPSA